jgi:ribosomal protein S27AE
MTVPVCPSCGEPAIVQTTRFGTRHVCGTCNLWSWNGKPLVDARTHEARRNAHACFDVLWKVQGWGRAEAYRALAEHLHLPLNECHIGQMDAQTAESVPGIALKLALEGVPA